MSLIKDVFEDNKDYVFRARIKHMLSPAEWMRHHKWRKQRADRGWSDRDTWGAGDHIARMTAEMLGRLHNDTYVDWPEWFKLNVKEEGKNAYTSLPQVIDDITKYLKFTETSWADDLSTKNPSLEEIFEKQEDGNYLYKSPTWYDEKGKAVSDAAITNRINKWSKEEQKLYKKAQKAMMFFGRHFSSFWD